MIGCCYIQPFRETPWDPHRQAEPVRLWHAYDGKTLGGIASFAFRWRGQGHDQEAGRRMKALGVASYCVERLI